MPTVAVPVRYPLTEHSERTLGAAIAVAEERDANLTVLHVNPYQSSRKVTRTALKRAVESRIGDLRNARYLVRRGFLARSPFWRR